MEAIRVAVGGSLREQISQEQLAELVQQRTGRPFDKFKISRLERGAQDLSRQDAIDIASVDPEQRGPAWLMFGEDEGGQGAELRTDAPPRPTNGQQNHHTVDRLVPKTYDTRRVRKGKRKPGDRTAMVV